MDNPNMWHLHEHIFGYLNHKTVEICRRVCKVWRESESLKKISHVKFIEEFGDREVEYELYKGKLGSRGKVSTIIPGWHNAVEKYVIKATIKDLEDVKDLLPIMPSGMVMSYPVHYAASLPVNNASKLMKIIFNTSYDLNDRNEDGYTVFHCACAYGRTELAELMIKSSKDFNIDLNAKTVWRWTHMNRDTETAFYLACKNDCHEVVELMIKSSKDFNIDLNARTDSLALHTACFHGYTKTVRAILRNWKEFGIDIKAEERGRNALEITKVCIQDGYSGSNLYQRYQQIKEMLENEYSQIDVTEPVRVCYWDAMYAMHLSH